MHADNFGYMKSNDDTECYILFDCYAHTKKSTCTFIVAKISKETDIISQSLSEFAINLYIITT